jgi:hypothetical protein
MFKIRGIFWNSNGFKDPKKHKFVSDLIKENNLNFIVVLETRRSDFTPRILKNLCAKRDYLWHSKPPKGRLGGMLLGVDLQFLTLVRLMKENIILNSTCVTNWITSSGH